MKKLKLNFSFFFEGLCPALPMHRANYQTSLYHPHENKKIERRVRKRYQQISREVGNPERTKVVGTNKMRDISKRPN